MLYLPVGPPGAGKTTLREWAVENGVIAADSVVCPDDIRLWMTGDRTRQDHNRDVFFVVDQVVKCRSLNGLDIWLDATNLDVRRGRIDSDNSVTTIVFDVPDDVLWERNRTRDFPVPDPVLERMISRFRTWKAQNAEPFITPESFKAIHTN